MSQDRVLDAVGEEEMDKPELLVESDYDGYFEGVVRRWIETKEGPFSHKRIVVTAGPYRPYAVTYHRHGDTIHLDFYSALRNGFGELSEQDCMAIKDLL